MRVSPAQTSYSALRAIPTAVLAALALAAPAAAAPARACEPPAPGGEWKSIAPRDAGFDAAKLQTALDFGATSAAESTVAVYRHGCLVGADSRAAGSRPKRFESWSAGKSIVSLAAGRAMTLGLLSPDDPVGSLVPEADRAHGRVTLRQLLEMAGGLHWNFYRDYSLTTPNRLNDALTLAFDHTPGTYFEYSQSTVSLVTAMVQRAVGEDFQAFVQRELFGPIGIKPGTWSWTRDPAGNTVGFMGLQLQPADYARLGQLMLHRGTWNGRKLINEAYMDDATTPTKANPGYGWFLWNNAGTRVVAPTTTSRQEYDTRLVSSAPADMFSAIGLNDQLIMVFPKLDLVLTRSGGAGSGGGGPVGPTGNAGFKYELVREVMAAVTDTKVPRSGPFRVPPAVPNKGPAYGVGTSAAEADQVAAAKITPPLPARGPAVAGAVLVGGTAVPDSPVALVAGRDGTVRVPLSCPKRGETACAGTLTLAGAKASFRIARGARGSARLKLSPKKRPRGGRVRISSSAPAGPTVSDADVTVKWPS
jgi:CubicO group peptidase (beta-lactamase class C family)